ncbi:unnamed protein product [Peronospora farinosa]|uniref:Uncharacterized protein n=1 Tax=Peronospora farinosa TaxID=134698 RepID=A0AAV0TUB8_9STRA|nr:unnamed protein product [Peronospora farinosa]CAI5727547.1 unnamed protein product [Peronospora farinosa]
MSISVSRESISKLMGELVDTFPMEAEGRSSISDFGKLLFTEGQANSNTITTSSFSTKTETKPKASTILQTGSKRVYTEIKGIPRQKQHDIMKTKDKAVPKRWTPTEDEKLRDAVGRHGERNWKSIAEEVPGRNHTQCLQRWTKVLAPGLVKGHWRPDEDELLKELVAEGRKNWGQVATRIPGRTSKQCRERWYNHLDPSIIRGEYSQAEDRMILDAQSRLGNRWSAIAAMLPGRTEDAVKIRWKSLCRVRKGHGRRGQSGKIMTPKGIMEIPGQMMSQNGTGFNDNMVKSEEVAPFSMHSQPHGAQMVRLPNVQMVSATNMQSGNQLCQPHHQTMMAGNGIMYSTDIRGGGYDPTMAHYRKPLMQQQNVNNGYDHPLPSPGSMTSSNAQDILGDHRSNIPLPVPFQSQDGYRQGYPGSSPTYALYMNGGMYSTGSLTPRGGMSNGSLYGNRTLQMDTYRPGLIYSQHLPSHQPQQDVSQHAQTMSYNYVLPSGPSSTEDINRGSSASHSMLSSNNGMNDPVAGFVQQHLRQQEPHQFAGRSPSTRHHQAQEHYQSVYHQAQAHEQTKSNHKMEPPVLLLAHSKQSGTSGKRTKQESRHGLLSTPSSQAMPNPAAMFARSQAAKASPGSCSGNPVAAFVQMQHHPKPNSASKKVQAGPQRPFNLAATFAQRFQAGQKAPISSSNSAGSAKSNDDPANEDDSSENGSGCRTNEPSLKKVKPRLSIDAARASAARRMRNSCSGGNLAGRGSLDVFLNEIGDVGRLSDLKMDEFQTLDELWRVSGDMDRLSL